MSLVLLKMQQHPKSRKLIMGYGSLLLTFLSFRPGRNLCIQCIERFCSIFYMMCLQQLAKKLHPDTNKEDPEAETKFQEVQKAYEVYSECSGF